jgi:ubiquinone/menaquinone biosynthesis C-methylase UbiE
MEARIVNSFFKLDLTSRRHNDLVPRNMISLPLVCHEASGYSEMKKGRAKNRVKEYFDRAAVAYETRVTSGALGCIRRREKKAVMEMLEPKPGDNVLDAGCGSGFYSLEIKRRAADVIGLDLSQRMVESARRNGIDAQVADLENLTLDGSFDRFCVPASSNSV